MILNGTGLNESISWDGWTVGDRVVHPAAYSIVVKAVDEYGNVGDLEIQNEPAWVKFFKE